MYSQQNQNQNAWLVEKYGILFYFVFTAQLILADTNFKKGVLFLSKFYHV